MGMIHASFRRPGCLLRRRPVALRPRLAAGLPFRGRLASFICPPDGEKILPSPGNPRSEGSLPSLPSSAEAPMSGKPRHLPQRKNDEDDTNLLSAARPPPAWEARGFASPPRGGFAFSRTSTLYLIDRQVASAHVHCFTALGGQLSRSGVERSIATRYGGR